MANELKKLVVKEMIPRFRKSNGILVVDYQGITAMQFDELRRELRKKNVGLEIVKNSLASIAFKELGFDGMVSLLKGPTAIVAGADDPVVVAKETMGWLKKIPQLRLRGGLFDGAMLSADGIDSLAKLPSMPVLRTQIVTSINTPIVGVVSAFNAILGNLVTVLQAVSKKKEESGG